jgi:hypothetical protein
MDRASQTRLSRLTQLGGPLAALVLAWSAVGCATASPSPEARRVIPVNGVLGSPCVNLGTVVGEGEASGWGSGSTTREQLASAAMNDAMERAAARGGTHIFLSPVTVREKDGAPASATLTGVAFRCPPQAQ